MPLPLAPLEPAVLDPERLAAVAATGLLDSARAESWDGLTTLAARLLRAPMAFLTLVDESRSFWLSGCGVDPDGPRQNPAEQSFCQYVITDRAPFAVGDAAIHPRTAGNPSVELMGVRAWAGCPVLDPEGQPLGSFCVMDVEPRTWSEDDVEVLKVLSQAAAAQVALLAAIEAERRSEDRLTRLREASLALLHVQGPAELTDVLVERGLPVLGVDGGGVVVREADGFRIALSARFGEQTQLDYAHLPLDSPLPGCHVARTGVRLVLPDRASGLAFSPHMEQVYRDTGRSAWAFTPLAVGDRLLGSLAVAWADERPDGVPTDELEIIDAFAAQCAQALDRLRAEAAQRESAQVVARLAEALQRSLLTQPPAPAGVELAVRYLPAVEVAQVGGDWHDAFSLEDGSLLVSVGDVAGHDRGAAAGMAQVRTLLRGLALAGQAGPAALLERLDCSLDRLGLDLLATALLVQVQDGGLRWSSAGHLPPLLRAADGTVQVLDDASDLMLGVLPGSPRTERTCPLPPGTTVLLCTDGLVERRTEGLAEGLDRLVGAFADLGGLGLEALSDALLDRMLPEAPEDDVALLVLRAP